MKKYLPHIALSLFLAEIMLILLSWLLSAAMPNSGIRSLLSGEGLRWFMGHFGNILATPQLAWLLLAAIAVGALTYALIVFCYRQHFVVGAICQHEDRALYATHKLLYQHGGTGLAEHAAQHLAQFFLGFIQRRENQHSLTSTETIGLQYIRGWECLQEGEAFFQIVGCDALIASGRNGMAHHETFGKLLAAFQLCTFFCRAYHSDMLCLGIPLDVVVDTLYQWVFGAYYYHVDTFL